MTLLIRFRFCIYILSVCTSIHLRVCIYMNMEFYLKQICLSAIIAEIQNESEKLMVTLTPH